MLIFVKSSFIIIQDKAIDFFGKTAADTIKGRRAFIVADSGVAPLYLDTIDSQLSDAGFKVASYTIPTGENAKNIDNLIALWNGFHSHGITRHDVIVALGGGVIGDLSGFAAATYLRGVPFIQVPTSLLAQVDSSIGGKTGINLPFGKNLVGAFHQSAATIIDPSLLKTLPPKEFRDGIAEVVKYACIRDAKLFDTVFNHPEIQKSQTSCMHIIERCASIKATLVERDEKDVGARMLLNFGHTVGHAIETLNKYQGVTHGEAVAIGMVIAAKMGEIHGVTPPGVCERLEEMLAKYGLPTTTTLPADDIFKIMLSDKKKQHNGINFIFLRDIGDAVFEPLDPDLLLDLLKKTLA